MGIDEISSISNYSLCYIKKWFICIFVITEYYKESNLIGHIAIVCKYCKIKMPIAVFFLSRTQKRLSSLSFLLCWLCATFYILRAPSAEHGSFHCHSPAHASVLLRALSSILYAAFTQIQSNCTCIARFPNKFFNSIYLWR